MGDDTLADGYNRYDLVVLFSERRIHIDIKLADTEPKVAAERAQFGCGFIAEAAVTARVERDFSAHAR
jgi:hypothetical protein